MWEIPLPNIHSQIFVFKQTPKQNICKLLPCLPYSRKKQALPEEKLRNCFYIITWNECLLQNSLTKLVISFWYRSLWSPGIFDIVGACGGVTCKCAYLWNSGDADPMKTGSLHWPGAHCVGLTGFACLCFPNVGIVVVCCHAQLFLMWALGIQIRLLKHFANWALEPAYQ